MIAQNLVDGLRLVLFPVVLGTGARIFDAFGDKTSLQLLDTRRVGDGLVRHTYKFVHGKRQ